MAQDSKIHAEFDASASPWNRNPQAEQQQPHVAAKTALKVTFAHVISCDSKWKQRKITAASCYATFAGCGIPDINPRALISALALRQCLIPRHLFLDRRGGEECVDLSNLSARIHSRLTQTKGMSCKLVLSCKPSEHFLFGGKVRDLSVTP